LYSVNIPLSGELARWPQAQFDALARCAPHRKNLVPEFLTAWVD
jgi:hypothetical protein